MAVTGPLFIHCGSLWKELQQCQWSFSICPSLLSFQQATRQLGVICMNWLLSDGYICISWYSAFALQWQGSTIHLALGRLPGAATILLWMVTDSLPPHAQQYHFHEYYSTQVHPAERQASVDILWSWVHAKWQDVEAALSTGRDECAELPAIFSNRRRERASVFINQLAVYHLVILIPAVSLYLWSLISSERSVFTVSHGYLVPFSGSHTH